MPRLIRNGPDIPPKVLQAQEEGRLIFFCGAGISKQAGLPLFGELIEKVYVELGDEKDNLERIAFDKQEYDKVFSLLERKDRYDPTYVRASIQKIFGECYNGKLLQHKHLLALADTGDEGYRIITTNFDDLFRMAGAKEHLIDSAPKLSIPKPAVWRTLVHLHGRLNDGSDPDYLNLVLSSRDFGAAYLVDRWASRFITELFRNFTVVFIGYRVEDPPMKYIMDALAAARGRGEGFREAYAFVSYDGSPGTAVTRNEEWRYKEVEPILYATKTAHTLLYNSLRQWALLSKRGLTSRSYLAMRVASTPPLGPASDNEDSQRVVWALNEPTGIVAEEFANQSHPAPLEWLEVFDDAGFFDMPEPDDTGESAAEKGETPSVGAALVDHGFRSREPRPLHPLTKQLARWLCHHLNDKRLIDWVLKRGAVLHPNFQSEVSQAVAKEGRIAPVQRAFWDVLCSERFAELTTRRTLSIIMIDKPLGLSKAYDTLRLIDLLTPVPVLSSNNRALEAELLSAAGEDDDAAEHEEPKVLSLQELVRIEVEFLAGDWTDSIVEQLKNDNEWLSQLSDELTTLLKQALDWYAVFDRANEDEDSSYIDFPSVSDHEQNQGFHEWTKLAELLRDSFQIVARQDKGMADTLIRRWQTYRYPLFRRFVVFASTELGGGYVDEVIDHLIRKHPWDLWAPQTQREVLRFFRKRGAEIRPVLLRNLCRQILRGPPKRRFKSMSRGDWTRIREREIWLSLAKLKQAGARLPRSASLKLEALDEAYPWRVAPNNSDEFPFWMGPVTWGPPPTEHSADQILRMPPEETAERLIEEKRDRDGLRREWEEVTRRDPDYAFRTLLILISRNEWPSDIWMRTIWALTIKEKPEDPVKIKENKRNWKILSALLIRMPDERLSNTADAAGKWLRASPVPFQETLENRYWRLWDKIWVVSENGGEIVRPDDDNAVTNAINHPAGYLAEALLRRLWERNPQTGDKLPGDLRPRFDAIAATPGYGGYLGRVILASRLPNLFALDPDWTQGNLIPRMVWGHSDEVNGLWQGFMWAPRFSPKLMSVLKGPFLDAVVHSEEIGGQTAINLRRVFAFVCLDISSELRGAEINLTLKSLSADQLADVAKALKDALENAKEKRAALWKDSISKFMRAHWPRAVRSRSPSVTDALASIAVAAGEAFPSAVQDLIGLLTEKSDRPRIIHDIERNEPDLPDKYPERVLDLLYATTSMKLGKRHRNLRRVLDRIGIAAPRLRETKKYRSLLRVA